MRKLEGKTAYVTGGGRGIGRAVSLKLASDGAKVVVNDLDLAPAEEVVAEIKTAGGEAIAFAGSVTESGFAENFIKAGVEAFGGVDIIVNNAGFTWDSLIGKMTDAQFDAIMDVHLKAPFQILRAASEFIIPAAKQEIAEGRQVMRKIVNISSIAGLGGNAGQANYASAKAAIVGLSKTLSKEWGRYNVNVNSVAFGLISTRLTEASDEKKMIDVEGRQIGIGLPTNIKAGFEAMIPLRRSGTVEEAAGGVWLLCTPESDYISGQTLVVGGGFTF